MPNLKINTNIRGFKSSIRKLRTGLVTVASNSLEASAGDVATNIKKRLKQKIATGTGTRISSNISASKAIYNGGTIVVGIGNIEQLNSATAVFSSSGNKYYLWKLLEEGWGKAGGKRPDKYVITPTEGKQALKFYVNGDLVYAGKVEHPGFVGHFFFMDTVRNWYIEDRAAVHKNLLSDVQKFLLTINYSG